MCGRWAASLAVLGASGVWQENCSDGKESTCSAGDLGLIPGLGRSPEKGMATHSRVLAWRIAWTGAWWATVRGAAECDMT